jgi:hypothetical protein
MKTLSIAVITLAIAFGVVAMAADPFVGTWKINLEKSKYDPGPAPKSLILKILAEDDGIKIVNDRVGADGKPTHSEMSIKIDGKNHPATWNPNVDAYVATRIDTNSYETVWKKDGKEVAHSRIVVSRDGKTLTNNVKGTGRTEIVVLERQ